MKDLGPEFGPGLSSPTTSASFRPEDEVCVLRGYLRQRQTLIASAGQSIQHMQKALEQMNIKLTEVVSDITGVTGMLILEAILRGERDPQRLARFRHKQCHRSEEEIARALKGNWREEHLFALRQAMKTYKFERRQLAECDREIEKYLKTMADRSGGAKLAPNGKAQRVKVASPSFDSRTLLFRFSGVDLTIIEGIDASSALTILSEIGEFVAAPTGRRGLSGWPPKGVIMPKTPWARSTVGFRLEAEGARP